MFWLLFSSAFSSKIETELAIKYTASCPNSRESMLVIDNGKDYFKPVRNGITRIRLTPGYHKLEVSHPWCTFYPVDLTLYDDGKFSAVSNSTTQSSYPIAIKHLPNQDDDPIMMLFKSPTLLLIGGIPLLFMFLKKKFLTPEMMLKLQEKQKELAEQKKQLEERQKAK